MARNTKSKFARTLAGFALLLVALAGAAYYAFLSEVPIAFAQKPTAVDAQEAFRKLKLLNEAHSSNRNGFIRLSESEINALLLQRFAKSAKDQAKVRTDCPLQLVKAGVRLNENDITFVTWHSVSVLGRELSVVWQRTLVAEQATNGWSLALRGMRVGKVQIPRQFWSEPNQLLGASDSIFEEQKAWLGALPTVMLSRNEVSEKPEVRLYTYIPVIKDSAFPAESESEAAADDGVDKLSAKLDL